MAHISQDDVTLRLLRRSVGVIGIALPFVLAIGNALFVGKPVLLDSLSGAYYTYMRDVWVGSLSAIGVFLICYRYALPDQIVTSFAGFFAIIVALFHPASEDRTLPVSSTERLIGYVHMGAAAALLLSMAYICLFRFTRVELPQEGMTPQKRVRNGIYYTCGIIIVLSLIWAGISYWIPSVARSSFKPLFWAESLTVVAFGVAWLVKGETIFKDT
jgi:hypothetical protein